MQAIHTYGSTSVLERYISIFRYIVFLFYLIAVAQHGTRLGQKETRKNKDTR